VVEPLTGDRIYSFPGGLKLRHHKAVSCEHPVQRPSLPEAPVCPDRQHQGDAGECWSEGDQVLKPVSR
jgi:Na+-translocating ferredoxin:NAD+ oxidoreductase subunit C